MLSTTEEIGWSFSTQSPETVSSGRVYISEPPLGSVVQVGDAIDKSYVLLALYNAGDEALTGPMRQSLVEISGGSITGSPNFTHPGAASVRDALYYAGTDSYVNFTSAVPIIGQSATMQFNFTGHPELDGKRIVRMELLYVVAANSAFIGNCIAQIGHYFGTTPGTLSLATPSLVVESAEFLAKSGLNFDTFPSVDMPTFNSLYSTLAQRTADIAAGAPLPMYPWTYDRLTKLDIGAGADAQCFTLDISVPAIADSPTVDLELYYAALRVTYCEEKRLVFGGEYFGPLDNSVQMSMRTPALGVNDGLIPAGQYTLTAEGGSLDIEVHAVRELYPMPQVGVLVEHTDRLGEAFEAHPTDQMVMLSLHRVNDDTIIGPHAYGDQAQGDVYSWPDNTLAQQLITNNSQDGTLEYPHARFYARRFGATSDALSLTSDANPAVTASITVAEFDALPEIAEGWKQIDLTFAPPRPTFDDSGTQQTWYWSSNTPAGSHWQVLVASSYALTNTIPATVYTGSNAPLRNSYGSDQAYATVNDVAQTSMDYTLMFAQVMPEVSGFALTQQTLPVTGIGLDCGLPPDCVPTGISYHDLTWSSLGSASVPASGFGFYELQRSDDIDPTWSTILQAFSPLVTGFHDFEARTGIESHYRIRFQHRLLFPSAWSATVDATLPAPGITGDSGANGTGVLIFTSNERQTGSASLAYSMVWEGDVEEQFTFVEADNVELQQMYGRDYQIAFRPLERGGERFTRMMLVQAAAVPDGLIQHGFTSLRDLAWEDLSYVCVRDELGDRWLATVIVPEGVVERNRTLYFAQVEIVEVTATPSIVTLPDPVMGSGGSSSSCIAALWDGIPGWDYGCWT